MWQTANWIEFGFREICILSVDLASQVVPVLKNLPANAEDSRDSGSVPELGRSPGEGMATHSSILARNPMNRGAWWVALHGVTKSQTWLSTHILALALEFTSKVAKSLTHKLQCYSFYKENHPSVSSIYQLYRGNWLELNKT